MSHYHDGEDLKLLPELKRLAPDEFKGFVALDAIVGKEDGKIPRKYRELIALAVAFTTQCPYCLDVHTNNAKRAGATREEVAEAAFLAAALRAGAAVTRTPLAQGKVHRIGVLHHRSRNSPDIREFLLGIEIGWLQANGFAPLGFCTSQVAGGGQVYDPLTGDASTTSEGSEPKLSPGRSPAT